MRTFLLVTLIMVTACEPPTQGPRLYHTEDYAPSLSSDGIEALEHMGATLIDQGVNFAVYSARAERLELLLFESADDELPVQQFEMAQIGDVWNLYVEGVGIGQGYGFAAWGPNWPYDPEFVPGTNTGFLRDVDDEGNRFNPNKMLTDPYGLALHRDHDWGRGSLGTGESRRTESTWGAASKSVIINSDYAWSDNEDAWRSGRVDGTLEGHNENELVIYEVHPKGLTANGHPDVDHPGTYRGIGEIAPYLQALGINAVELLPIHEKPLDGGYWGYNNISFFAPEVSYSAEFTQFDRPEEVIDEFKEMVDALHRHDIEVIIDVVYNHTGEGGLWREKLFYNDYTPDASATANAVNLDSIEVAGLYNLRGLDNWSYYALNPDGQTYWNNTGVGNQTRPNHDPMQRLILDSLHFMVEELHVDGFRFDLAGILGEQDENYNDWFEDPTESALGVIANDLVLQENNVRIIAEPWTAGGWYNPVLGAYPAATNRAGYGWGEWNAHFRDITRSLINEDDFTLDRYEGAVNFGGVYTGSYDMYAHNGRNPAHSMNFVTVHDGFTMFDLLSFGEKENSCGVLNPVCCDDPFSSWCEIESGEAHNRSRDWGDDTYKRQLMRDMFAMMLLSHGTPLLLGGDEWMRTQYGNNNAYSTWADNEFNWFRWGEWHAADERWRMMDFVAELIRFRKEHVYALSPAAHNEGMPFTWKNADNSGDPDWSGKHLMVHYYQDDAFTDAELALLINFEDYDVTYTLPGGRTWARVLDTQQYFDDEEWFALNPGADTRASGNITRQDPEVVGETYTVTGRSIVVLEQQ